MERSESWLGVRFTDGRLMTDEKISFLREILVTVELRKPGIEFTSGESGGVVKGYQKFVKGTKNYSKKFLQDFKILNFNRFSAR